MAIYRPDMLFSKSGRPVAVVEAKAYPLVTQFERTARQQLATYSTQVGTPWVVLVDPKQTYVYSARDMERPIAQLSTEELLVEAFPSRPHIVGEQVILVALDRLVPHLRERQQFLRKHPELTDFADALAGAESTTDFRTEPQR